MGAGRWLDHLQRSTARQVSVQVESLHGVLLQHGRLQSQGLQTTRRPLVNPWAMPPAMAQGILLFHFSKCLSFLDLYLYLRT
jgi:hypothetical protein